MCQRLIRGCMGSARRLSLILKSCLSQSLARITLSLKQLAVSLQFTGIVPAEKKQAAKRLASATVKGVRDYVETYRAGLPSTTLNSTKYSFNVFLVPKVVGRESLSDVAVEFVKVDETSSDELKMVEGLNVLIKEKHVPIANLDLSKPTMVVSRVQAELPYKFTVNGHTAAWKHFSIRPASGSQKPEATTSNYCVYDRAHKDYLYTKAWIQKLIQETRICRELPTGSRSYSGPKIVKRPWRYSPGHAVSFRSNRRGAASTFGDSSTVSNRSGGAAGALACGDSRFGLAGGLPMYGRQGFEGERSIMPSVDIGWAGSCQLSTTTG